MGERERDAIDHPGATRSPCPGTGWTRQTAVVQGVTNQAGGVDRNVFTYECSVNAAATCPAADSRVLEDHERRHRPVGRRRRHATASRSSNVATGVFLRNQNEAPTASVRPRRGVAKEQVLLNGSGSSDPEGRTLEYFWFEGAVPTAARVAATACTATPPGVAWEGVTFLKTLPHRHRRARPSTFYLLVRDPGCLTSLSAAINGDRAHMTHQRLSQRIADEQGWVLVSATILTLLMLSIALVAAGMIDNGTSRTREQRERESALNVDEGVLYAQSLVMQTAWPSAATTDAVTGPRYYPGTCTSAGPCRSPLPERAEPRGGQLEQPGRGRLPQRRRARRTSRGRRGCATTAARSRTAYDPDKADDLRRAGLHGSGRRGAGDGLHVRRQQGPRAVGAVAGDRARQAAQRRRAAAPRAAGRERAASRGHVRRRQGHQQRQPRRHADHRRDGLAGDRALRRPGDSELRGLPGRPDRAGRAA